jgi:hypothetical protein
VQVLGNGCFIAHRARPIRLVDVMYGCDASLRNRRLERREALAEHQHAVLFAKTHADQT